VPGAADSEPIAIHADHINVVKFKSDSDSSYQTVCSSLQQSRNVVCGPVERSRGVRLHVDRFVGGQEQLDTIYK
jgi:hypothetical protein